jgi:hypothetical protein
MDKALSNFIAQAINEDIRMNMIQLSNKLQENGLNRKASELLAQVIDERNKKDAKIAETSKSNENILYPMAIVFGFAIVVVIMVKYIS